MKPALIAFIIGTLTLISCEKKYTSTMTVVRDCTGTYLSEDDICLPVCNYGILSDISDGKEVVVTYKKVGDNPCEGRGMTHCTMIFSYSIGEWIEITKL